MPFAFRSRCKPIKLVWARQMRRNPTKAEAYLWQRLKRKQLGGLRFKRQQVIFGWIADFYCPKLRLVVEVDGGYHDKVKDARRDAVMISHGFSVIRFENEDVLLSRYKVIALLKERMNALISEIERRRVAKKSATGLRIASAVLNDAFKRTIQINAI